MLFEFISISPLIIFLIVVMFNKLKDGFNTSPTDISITQPISLNKFKKICNYTTIEFFLIKNIELTSEQVDDFIKMMRNNKNLSTLIFYSYFNDVRKIINEIKINTTIKKLYINVSGYYNDEFNDILKFNKTISELYCQNSFEIDVEKFKFNNTLTKLYMTTICNNDMLNIIDILRFNKTLKIIEFGELLFLSKLTPDTEQKFIDVLNINKTLEYIKIGNETYEKINEKLQENKYYREIIKPRIEQENFYLNLFLTKSIIKIPNLVRDEFGNFLHTI